MRKLHKPLISIVLLFAGTVTALAIESDTSVRRFGIFVGENDGGSQRITLNYAESDAENMNDLMEELGGMRRADTLLYLEAGPEDLKDGINDISSAVSEASDNHRRVELMFYFSGHSDEYGIMLGEEIYPYIELKNDLTEAGADVTIVVLDSCSSGTFTQLRGGSRQSPFLIDESTEMQGHAFLTSSSAAEAAQESQRIGSAFFTYYLISGLRGAADSSRDGKVSLNEAYDYAYNETLNKTTGTIAGPQHASYNIQLSGSGDLVLTDIRETDARLNLSAGIEGKLYIRNSREQLIAEIQKYAGQPLQLAFPPDEYRITIETGEDIQIAEIDTRFRDELTLSEEDFHTYNLVAYESRGNEENDYESRAQELVRENSPLAGMNKEDFFESIEVEDTPESMENPKDNEALPSAPRSGRYSDMDEELAALIEEVLAMADPGYQREESSLIEVKPQVEATEAVPAYPQPVSDTEAFEPGFFHTNLLSFSFGIPGSDRFSAGLVSTFNYDFYGIDIEALLSIGSREAHGIMVSPIANIYGGNSSGVHIGGVFNLARQNFNGFQTSWVFNLTGAETDGFQLAGVFNLGQGTVKGFQGSGVFNISGSELRGGQLSGVFNIAKGESTGFQTSGLFNVNEGAFRGFQGAGLFNISAGNLNGVQLGGIFNTAENLAGVQIAPIINIAKKVDGVQIGLVNVAEEVKGVSIGVVNIIGNGLYHFNTWFENDNMTYLAFQTGSKMLYTTYTFGAGIGDMANPVDFSRCITGLSLGTHVDLGPFYGELEAGYRQLFDFSQEAWGAIVGTNGSHIYGTMRLHVGLALGERFAFFGGCSVDGLFLQNEGFTGIHTGDPAYVFQAGGENHPIYLNPYLGIRF